MSPWFCPNQVTIWVVDGGETCFFMCFLPKLGPAKAGPSLFNEHFFSSGYWRQLYFWTNRFVLSESAITDSLQLPRDKIMKFVLCTFEITKGFDRWQHLVDVELKAKCDEYGVRVHFACANDDETRIWDMSEIDDPSRAEAFLGDEEVQKLRVEAGVVVESHKMLSTVDKFKIW